MRHPGTLVIRSLVLALAFIGFANATRAAADIGIDVVATPTPSTSAQPSSSAEPSVSAQPGTTARPDAGQPGRPADMRVYAIGDSVMLGAKSCLQTRGYTVDAQGSRRASAVANELGLRRTKLPRRVVIHTGTNGGATVADLERIVRAIGPGHEIVFVTVQLPDHSKYSFEERTNDAIETVVKRSPSLHVADWHAWSDEHPGLTYGDGIHLPPAGCRAFSYVVASALRNT